MRRRPSLAIVPVFLLLASSFAVPACSLDAAGTDPNEGLFDDDGLGDASADGFGTVDSAELPDDGPSDEVSVDATADVKVDTTIVDSGVVGDTGALDTTVVDTFIADTFVADTFVADSRDAADTEPLPDTSYDARDSAVFDTGPFDSGTFTDGGVPCNEPGAIVYRGHCYFLIGPSGMTLNWFEARDACTARGNAHLVTITSSQEQNAVRVLGSGERWIGLRQPGGNGVYEWLGGGGTSGYDNWASGEPNDSGDCVRMIADHTWADHPCNTTYPAALCERD